MNRTIKFRVWDFREKKFINEGYSDFLALDLDGTLIRVQTDSCETPSREVTGNFEIMQFTGLTDKNGKEIYEGDLLTYKGEVGAVEWSEKYSGWWVNFFDGTFMSNLIGGESMVYEIIGNIHENPELLS